MDKRKLIVFDWNGTILSDTLACWRASNKCLEYFGRPAISLHRYRETVNFPVIHFYTRNGCKVDDVLKLQDEANSLFYEHYLRESYGARTRSGVRELLQWLKDQGHDCTILSNYLTDKIQEQLERLKLEQYFFHVCGNTEGGTVLQHATKRERLSAFIQKRGYLPENIYLIGDSTEEPEIAHHLGLKSISITGGYFSTTRLKATEPDYMIHNMKDVIEILKIADKL